MATTLDTVLDDIAAIQAEARSNGFRARPRWPMIILHTPKGWTGPKEVDGERRPVESIVELAPRGQRRMGANPHANGGLLLQRLRLRLPDFRAYAVDVPKPGSVMGEARRVLGYFLRDVMKRNIDARNFRVFGPDETASNRLGALYEVTGKTSRGPFEPVDEHLSPDGRVMEVLSEHLCQGWLEAIC